jgi:hypothetical protein
MIRFLSSTRLTISLCLALAAGGIAGSLLYQGNTAFGKQLGTFNVFRSPLFLVPAGLLLLNILFCAGSRFSTIPFHSIRTWTFGGIHLGLILLAAGLLADGLFGFVGTQYFPIGVPSSSYFNWRTNREEAFPFTVEVTDSKVRFHPLNLQVGIRDREGNKVGVFTVREGASFRAGSPPITVTPRRFDIGTKTLFFDAQVGDTSVSGVAVPEEGSSPVKGYVVVPVAFADPEPSGFLATVRFSLPGKTPVEKEIRVNEPASFAGFSFCLVAQNVDQYRNPIVGLQMTREPGEPAFWAGALLFGLSLLAHLYAKRPARMAVSAAAEEELSAASGRPVTGAKAGLVTLLLVAWGALLVVAPAEGRGIGRVIFDEETWEGEVRLSEPVTVEKGATLRILAGTTVLLSGEDRDGDGCRDGYIQTLGSLIISGEKERPVVFRRLDPERAWEEVFLLDAEGSIRHAIFEGGLWGLHVHDGNVTVENVVFRGNEGGARLKGSGASFIRCTFRGNGIALRFWDGGPSVVSSVIEGNGTGLFYREGAGGGRITGNIIDNREWNLKIGDWATGDLDASGNYWGAKGDGKTVLLVRDFREKKAEGRIRLLPALSSPPGGCGAEGAEGR